MKESKTNIISELDKKSVVTIGMFDGVHIGHQHILHLLKSIADREHMTPVVVTFDSHPRIVLGKTDAQFRLLTTLQERESILRRHGIEHVDWVHFTPHEAQLSACEFVSKHLLQHLHMGALVLGYDNQFGNKNHNDFHLLPQLAAREGFAIYHDTPVLYGTVEVSSTEIRRALLAGNIDLANQMLGTSYSITGQVVTGRQIGRSLGFPTANIALNDAHKALPAHGVYAAWALMPDGSRRKAMVNIGTQPTFHHDIPTIEAHILDLDADIYHQSVTLSFTHRLRATITFDTPDQLVQQLQLDKEMVRKILEEC